MPIPPRLHTRYPARGGITTVSGMITVALPTFYTFWPWALTLWTKFTNIGEDPLPTKIYYSAEFHRPASTHAGDIRYKIIADKQ